MGKTHVALAVVAALAIAVAGAQADIIAQTGFNDATGINPSDYADGAALNGKGNPADEPGWDGPWTASAGYTTSSAQKVEGDLSMKSTNAGATITTGRAFADQSGIVYVDALYMATGPIVGSDTFIMYSGPNTAGYGSQALNGGTATMVTLSAGTTGGAIRVSDHTTSGGFYTWVDTGHTWNVNQWVRVTQEIETLNDTYRVWVNGEPFDPAPANPLNFRSPSTFVDDFQLFLTNQGSTAIHVDQLRVLTHNPIALPAFCGFEPDGGYADGQTVIGKGLAEDGWTGNWVLLSGSGANAIAQSQHVRSGELALKLTAPSGAQQIIREFTDQSGLLFVDYDIMIDASLGANVYTYTGPQSEPSQTAATMVNFFTNGNITVGDGDGAGGRQDRDTGYDWTVGQWHHVHQQINIPGQIFNVWIDGQKCINPADPLGYGFRGTSSYIDDIKFLLQSQGSNVGIYIDNIRVQVPEPATLALLGGGIGLAALRRRRRRGKLLRKTSVVALALLLALGLGALDARASIVAQTGFNDAAGINPSDYTDGTTMIGKGTGEPGWTSAWTAAYLNQNGYFTTTSSPVTEGDLSGKINTASGSSTVIAYRNFTPQTGVVYLDTMVQSPTSLSNGDVAFILYTLQSGGGVATMMNLGAGATSGNVKASDQGATDGSYTFVDTTYDWAAGQWVRWTQEIDVPNKTYKVWVNGYPFDPAPANPLNFRNSSVSQVSRVQLFLAQQSNAASSVRVDELRVLTHNPLKDPIHTGFEASAGYVNGETIIGKGAGEYGWTTTWDHVAPTRNHGHVTAESGAPGGSGQALSMVFDKYVTGNADFMITRSFLAQYEPFLLDFDLMVDTQLYNGLHIYTAGGGAYGFNMAFDPGATSGSILARQGTGSGGLLVDTGVDWTIDQWTHVRALIDPLTQSYDLWLDGVGVGNYGFRGTPTYLDSIQFLMTDQGGNHPRIYIDNICINVPEPTTMLLLGGGIGLAALRRRRRRGKLLRKASVVALALLLALGLGALDARASIVAQTGFNDAVGINPSDYTNGGGLNGKGAGEPGWTNNWATAHTAYYNTTSSPVSEGDLSLKIHTTTGSSTVLATREFSDQTGIFYVDTMLQSTSSLTGFGFIMYTIDSSTGATATMVNLNGSGAVNASDQTTNNNYTFVPTGHTWTANRWVRLTQEIDVPNQTYRTWVNGHLFDPAPANPLNFRGNAATSIDKVQLFLAEQGSSTARSIRLDELRVLTTNPLTTHATTSFDDADYVVGQTVIGKGSGEPGWTGNWEVHTGRYSGSATVALVSGDPALKMTSPDTMIIRNFEDQNTQFWLDFDVMIDATLTSGFHIYTGDETGTGFNMAFDTSYRIMARHGDGNDTGPMLDTGFDWAVGQWTHIRAAVDCVSQTYELWIDGSEYVTAQPLGFRNKPQFIDDIRFLLLSQSGGASGPSVYIDNIHVAPVPEPTTMLLLGSGIGLAALRRRRSA